SGAQVFLTAPSDRSPSNGPALTFSSLVPDVHHYNGRGGRVFPLWRDAGATESDISQSVLSTLSEKLGRAVSGEEVMAYVAALLAHPAYTARFQADLAQPGLRVPLTADRALFEEAVE